MRGSWICTQCGEANERAYEVCFNCGMARRGTPDPGFRPDGLDPDGAGHLAPRRGLRLLRSQTFVLFGLLGLLWIMGLYWQGRHSWAALLAFILTGIWLLTRPHRLSLMKQDLWDELAAYNQQHLLAFWDTLEAPAQRQLAEEIRAIDFAQIRQLHSSGPAGEDWAALAARAEPPPAIRLHGQNAFTPPAARQAGEAALVAGQVGVILVAGGQGTRLGFNHPKGMFPIGPVSKSSLFRILFEKLLAMQRRYSAALPLYVMTSPATHEETQDYLARHENFGVPEDNVHLFCQGVMPAVDEPTGRVLLAAPGHLALSPDGHGGMLSALQASGGLADIRRRGLRQLFYFQVDNPLVYVCDPEFLGYHLLARSEMSTQVVAKRTPRDNVGNVVQINGRARILEYSDLNPLPDEIVLRKSPDGSPVFWAGNVAVHVMDVAFLERMSAASDSLPFHVARKKVPHLNEQGQWVEPPTTNAMKFERFIFDLLPAAERSIVMEVDEASVFAPLKNAAGAPKDAPETVQAQMMAVHRGWLRAAGGTIADDVPLEISPLMALDAQQLQDRWPQGLTIDRATFLTPKD